MNPMIWIIPVAILAAGALVAWAMAVDTGKAYTKATVGTVEDQPLPTVLKQFGLAYVNTRGNEVDYMGHNGLLVILFKDQPRKWWLVSNDYVMPKQGNGEQKLSKILQQMKKDLNQ